MEPLVLGAHENAGWIEVVCGSMFSGKTEELIRRLRRAEIAGQKVESFKPALDTRYRPEAVVSHDETSLAATPVDAAAQVLLLSTGADVVGIDEAQFLGPGLVEVCQELARSGVRVVVAGLDQDFRGRPFEPIPKLMAVAEHVTKLHAICVGCGAPANHSQRLAAGTGRVLVGAGEAYEPRCRRCFEPSAGEEPARKKPADTTAAPDEAISENTMPPGEQTPRQKAAGDASTSSASLAPAAVPNSSPEALF